MPKSSAARVTDRLAVRTAWAKAVLSSDTVLVLHGMTDPPKEESIITEKRHPCPCTNCYPCPCAIQKCRSVGLSVWVSKVRHAHRKAATSHERPCSFLSAARPRRGISLP